MNTVKDDKLAVDCFEVLGLKRGASQDEIRTAVCRLEQDNSTEAKRKLKSLLDSEEVLKIRTMEKQCESSRQSDTSTFEDWLQKYEEMDSAQSSASEPSTSGTGGKESFKGHPRYVSDSDNDACNWGDLPVKEKKPKKPKERLTMAFMKKIFRCNARNTIPRQRRKSETLPQKGTEPKDIKLKILQNPKNSKKKRRPSLIKRLFRKIRRHSNAT